MNEKPSGLLNNATNFHKAAPRLLCGLYLSKDLNCKHATVVKNSPYKKLPVIHLVIRFFELNNSMLIRRFALIKTTRYDTALRYFYANLSKKQR